MRRRHVLLTAFLLAPLAVVAILMWLIVGTLRGQENSGQGGRSPGAAADKGR